MNNLIKNVNGLKQFVRRFTDVDEVNSIAGSKFYCSTLYTKKNHDEEETRLVKRHIAIFNSNIDEFINEFLKETIKLDEMSNYIRTKDNSDYISTKNLAIYIDINPVLPNRVLCNHLSKLNDFIRLSLLGNWTENTSTAFRKFILGNGDFNSVMQKSTEKIFYDFDIDFPEIEKREWYHKKLITFFDELFNSKDYTLISTCNGAHLLFNRSIECQGCIIPNSKNFNKRLYELYKSILPDGNDEFVNLKDIVPELLRVYLEIPDELKEGQKKFEFTEANSGCPLVGCSSKGYVTSIIK